MATPKVGSKGGPPIFHHRVLQSQSSQIILAMCRNLNWASNHIQKLVKILFFLLKMHSMAIVFKSQTLKREKCVLMPCVAPKLDWALSLPLIP